MNPGYPTQTFPAVAVPGQDSGYPVKPGGDVQHTTVNIPTENPKDHIIWSLFNFLYGNICCLGLVAVIFSVKARDWKVLGDLNRARSSASTARNVNIVATVLMIVALVLYITMLILVKYQNY